MEVDDSNVANKRVKSCDYPEYDSLVDELARKLKLARHPDPSVTIKAARLLLEKRRATANSGEGIKIQRSKFSLDDIPLPKNAVANWEKALNKDDKSSADFERASKGLKLLYLDDQKQLQLKINEVISSIQSVTADPKTNSKLMTGGR